MQRDTWLGILTRGDVHSSQQVYNRTSIKPVIPLITRITHQPMWQYVTCTYFATLLTFCSFLSFLYFTVYLLCCVVFYVLLLFNNLPGKDDQRKRHLFLLCSPFMSMSMFVLHIDFAKGFIIYVHAIEIWLQSPIRFFFRSVLHLSSPRFSGRLFLK